MDRFHEPSRLLCRALLVLLAGRVLPAQVSDPGKELNQFLAKETAGRFKLTFEFRTRLETRTGNNFGLSPDLENPLFRTRVGAEWDATDWLRVSAMGQDARAPLYGGPAPASARDTMDLQQAYLEFAAKRNTGFGAHIRHHAPVLPALHRPPGGAPGLPGQSAARCIQPAQPR